MEDSDSSSSNRSYRVLLTRNVTLTAIKGFSGGLEAIYYKICLGISAMGLGFLSSISSLTVLSSILVCGWLNDRYGRKKSFILGSLLSSLSYLLLFLANDWYSVATACVLSALSSSLIAPALEYFLGVLTEEKNRCTSIATMSVLISVANMIVPPLGAFTIATLGGIRYVKYAFLVQFITSIIVLVYIVKRLKVAENLENKNAHHNPLKDFIHDMIELRELLKSSNARILVEVVIMSALAWSFPSSYWRLYAYEVCETPVHLMGLLTTAQSLTYSALSIPISRKADRSSKKEVIMKLRTFYWLSVIFLLIAGTVRTPYNYLIPIVAWALWGVGATLSSPWRSLAIEAVPKDYLARWNSLRNFIYYSVAMPCYLVSGYLWNIDPRLPFMLALGVDTITTFVLLPKIPEHSHSKD